MKKSINVRKANLEAKKAKLALEWQKLKDFKEEAARKYKYLAAKYKALKVAIDEEEADIKEAETAATEEAPEQGAVLTDQDKESLDLFMSPDDEAAKAVTPAELVKTEAPEAEPAPVKAESTAKPTAKEVVESIKANTTTDDTRKSAHSAYEAMKRRRYLQIKAEKEQKLKESAVCQALESESKEEAEYRGADEIDAAKATEEAPAAVTESAPAESDLDLLGTTNVNPAAAKFLDNWFDVSDEMATRF